MDGFEQRAMEGEIQAAALDEHVTVAGRCLALLEDSLGLKLMDKQRWRIPWEPDPFCDTIISDDERVRKVKRDCYRSGPRF